MKLLLLSTLLFLTACSSQKNQADKFHPPSDEVPCSPRVNVEEYVVWVPLPLPASCGSEVIFDSDTAVVHRMAPNGGVVEGRSGTINGIRAYYLGKEDEATYVKVYIE